MNGEQGFDRRGVVVRAGQIAVAEHFRLARCARIPGGKQLPGAGRTRRREPGRAVGALRSSPEARARGLYRPGELLKQHHRLARGRPATFKVCTKSALRPD